MIRLITPDDWEACAGVRLEALRTDPECFGARLAREETFGERTWRLRLSGSPWWVAGEPGAEHGIVGALLEPGAPLSERHLTGLWVAPGARRRGVASDLVATVAQWAREQGATRLTAWVPTDLVAATALFDAVGASATGERTALPRDPARSEERWTLGLSSRQ